MKRKPVYKDLPFYARNPRATILTVTFLSFGVLYSKLFYDFLFYPSEKLIDLEPLALERKRLKEEQQRRRDMLTYGFGSKSKE